MRFRQATTAITIVAATMLPYAGRADLPAEQQVALAQVIQFTVAKGSNGYMAALQSILGTMASSNPKSAAEITSFATKTLMTALQNDGSASSVTAAQNLVSMVVKAVVQAVPSAAPAVAAAVATAMSSSGASNSVAQAVTAAAYSTVVAFAPTQSASIMAAAPPGVAASVTQAVQTSLSNASASDTSPAANTSGAASSSASQNAAATSPTVASTAEIPRTDTASPSS